MPFVLSLCAEQENVLGQGETSAPLGAPSELGGETASSRRFFCRTGGGLSSRPRRSSSRQAVLRWHEEDLSRSLASPACSEEEPPPVPAESPPQEERPGRAQDGRLRSRRSLLSSRRFLLRPRRIRLDGRGNAPGRGVLPAGRGRIRSEGGGCSWACESLPPDRGGSSFGQGESRGTPRRPAGLESPRQGGTSTHERALDGSVG